MRHPSCVKAPHPNSQTTRNKSLRLPKFQVDSMGLKLSCIHHDQAHLPTSPAPAKVITTDGSLKELLRASSSSSSTTTVSDVLIHSHSDEASSFFVCNSDALYFNERPPALGPGEVLRPGQIYFVLPAAMLERPLSTADMAALAVRATTALASSASSSSKAKRRHGKKKKAVRRVIPVREETEEEEEDGLFNEKLNQQTLGEYGFGVVLLSPAVKSGREKLAAAAATSRLRRALSIIQEDAD